MNQKQYLVWLVRLLIGLTWLSIFGFAIYILANYVGSIFLGNPEKWNVLLPNLYTKDQLAANFLIGIHFLSGAILLLLGPIQLLKKVRESYPHLHRTLGKLYLFSCYVVGVGGLGFVFVKGTIGGWPMNLGFGLYGFLVLICAAGAHINAKNRNFNQHQAWAIRLFALVVGSWLYRMEYGFWEFLTGRIGHTKAFDGVFDIIMSFFFYIPNLILAELFIRKKLLAESKIAYTMTLIMLVCANLIVVSGTYFFSKYIWLPTVIATLRKFV